MPVKVKVLARVQKMLARVRMLVKGKAGSIKHPLKPAPKQEAL
jgi:hypothetical protein